MSTIDDLEAKAARLRDQLAAVNKSLREARVAACPVKVGDVVRDRHGAEYRVTHVVPWGKSSCDLRGNPRKKNGEWGAANRRIYGWEDANP